MSTIGSGYDASGYYSESEGEKTAKKAAFSVTGHIEKVSDAINPTYTKSGKMIAPSTQQERLFLGSGKDARFSVGLVDPNTVLFESATDRVSEDANFVRIDVTDEAVGQRTVVVSIKELADRLHLSQKQIRVEAYNGRLEAFLEERQQGDFSQLPEVIKEYDTIFSQYEERQGELISLHDQTKVQLTKKQLMKVVRTALLNQDQSPFFASEKSVSAKITLQSKQEDSKTPLTAGVQIEVGAHFGISPRKFVALQEPGQPLTLVQDASQGTYISEGSHGAVTRIQNISQIAMPTVTKLARLLDDESEERTAEEKAFSASTITEGATLLHTIHRELESHGLSSEGIMSAPFAVVNIRSETGEPLVVGWIGREYTQGDAANFLFLLKTNQKNPYTHRDFAQAALRALQGVANLHGIKRPHRDLKPENLLVALGPQGEIKLVIGDLDSCKKMAEIDFEKGEFKEFPGGISTPEFVSEVDVATLLEVIEELREERDESKKEELKSEIFDIFIAKDKFAMGATLYEWLAGSTNLPYATDPKTGYPILPDPFTIDRKPLETKGYPAEFIDGLIPLLENMLNPDWTQRSMSMQECTQEFARLIDSYL